ncbi:hypothetical protein [Streptomyces tsukubensis]|uniref:Uncharacterized protein n=1 Tax=Streptomyces tsukubensis TaxID=83656 RepID=A0A1V4A534_9ACTN|nr:hypothetical protein [Streptomyces tsukubensis]OON75338.1 hypothetical protein B1H18_22895 [Streptomyces tsukubensis]QFR95033.1 hypothetical protein GBW32_20890 [Streptomyces tsukubensis]
MSEAQDMNHPEEDEGELFAVSAGLPGGWFEVTLAEGTVGEATARAEQVLAAMNPLELQVREHTLKKDVVERALAAHEQNPVLSAVCYTTAGEWAASLDIVGFAPDGGRPEPVDMARMLYDWEDATMVAAPEVTFPELPSGPSARVRGTYRKDRRRLFGRQMAEFVRYAIYSPDIRSLVVMTATWNKFAVDDEVAASVDVIARGLEIESGETASEGAVHREDRG